MRGAKIRKKRHAPHSASFAFSLRVPPARASALRSVCPAPRFRRSVLCPPLPLIFSCLRSRSSSLPPFVPSARLLDSCRPVLSPPLRVFGLPSVRTSCFLPARPCRQPLPGPLRPCGKRETKAEGPKTLRRFPCLPLPAARYSIRSVNSRVWGGVQTWSSQLCQPTVQVAVPVPLPLTGSVSVTSFS